MKNLLKKLPIVAFVFAIVTAFAFNVPEDSATSWFAVDAEGNISTTAISNPGCIATVMEYCAVEFDNEDLIDEEPPFANVKDNGADQVYLDLTYKP